MGVENSLAHIQSQVAGMASFGGVQAGANIPAQQNLNPQQHPAPAQQSMNQNEQHQQASSNHQASVAAAVQQMGVSNHVFAEQFEHMQQLREQMLAQPIHNPRQPLFVAPANRADQPGAAQQQPQLHQAAAHQQNQVNLSIEEEEKKLMGADGSDTYRESVSRPAIDPTDINVGSRFVFLRTDATDKMRANKKKVRYVFQGEEEKKAGEVPDAASAKASGKQSGLKPDASPQAEFVQEQNPLQEELFAREPQIEEEKKDAGEQQPVGLQAVNPPVVSAPVEESKQSVQSQQSVPFQEQEKVESVQMKMVEKLSDHDSGESGQSPELFHASDSSRADVNQSSNLSGKRRASIPNKVHESSVGEVPAQQNSQPSFEGEKKTPLVSRSSQRLASAQDDRQQIEMEPNQRAVHNQNDLSLQLPQKDNDSQEDQNESAQKAAHSQSHNVQLTEKLSGNAQSEVGVLTEQQNIPSGSLEYNHDNASLINHNNGQGESPSAGSMSSGSAFGNYSFHASQAASQSGKQAGIPVHHRSRGQYSSLGPPAPMSMSEYNMAMNAKQKNVRQISSVPASQEQARQEQINYLNSSQDSVNSAQQQNPFGGGLSLGKSSLSISSASSISDVDQYKRESEQSCFQNPLLPQDAPQQQINNPWLQLPHQDQAQLSNPNQGLGMAAPDKQQLHQHQIQMKQSNYQQQPRIEGSGSHQMQLGMPTPQQQYQSSQPRARQQSLSVPKLPLDSAFDASKQLTPSQRYQEKRRGSVVETRTGANQEFYQAHKEVKVRTPRRGRSKSIVVPGTDSKPRSFSIGRLNNYNKTMKRHKGPLSMMSELESIEEVEVSDKYDSSSKHHSGAFDGKDFYYDADDPDAPQDAGFEEPIKQGDNHSMGSGSANLNSSMIEGMSLQSSEGSQRDLVAEKQYDPNSLRSNTQKYTKNDSIVKQDELKKIIQAQQIRNRSQSVIQNSSNAPVLQPIKNFGHGRRSNLVQKVQQLQRRAQRSKSIAVGDMNQHQFMLRAQMLINSQEVVLKRPFKNQESPLGSGVSQRRGSDASFSSDQFHQLSQQQKQDDANFSDFLMQFKDKIAAKQHAQEQQQPHAPSPFNREHGAQVKPLGLNKNKARAALNNLKMGNVTPRAPKDSSRAQEQMNVHGYGGSCGQFSQQPQYGQPNVMSASQYLASHQQPPPQAQMLAAYPGAMQMAQIQNQLNQVSSGVSSGSSQSLENRSQGSRDAGSFGNYTFQDAQNTYKQQAEVQGQKQARIMLEHQHHMEQLKSNISQQQHINMLSQQSLANNPIVIDGVQYLEINQGRRGSVSSHASSNKNRNLPKKNKMASSQSAQGDPHLSNQQMQKNSPFSHYRFGQNSNEESKARHGGNQAGPTDSRRNSVSQRRMSVKSNNGARRNSIQESSKHQSSARRAQASKSPKTGAEAAGVPQDLQNQLQHDIQNVDLAQVVQHLTKNGNPNEIMEILKAIKKVKSQEQNGKGGLNEQNQ